MSPNPIRIAEGSPCPSCFDSTGLILAAGHLVLGSVPRENVKCQGGSAPSGALLWSICLLFTAYAALSALCRAVEPENAVAPVAAKPKTDVTVTANAGPDQPCLWAKRSRLPAP